MKTARELRRWRCVIGRGLVALSLAGLPMAVWAQGPVAAGQAADPHRAQPESGDPETHWETLSVRELMHQDLRTALQTPQAGDPGRTVSGQGGPGILEPRLVALYGVGRALMAEVQVGRQAYLYVRGQAWPAGHVGDRGVYQLRGMNGACVQLERGEDRHSL